MDGRTPVRVAVTAITELEVSTGRHRKTVKGMLIGAGLGAALYGAVYASQGSSDCTGVSNGGVCFTSVGQAVGLGLAAGGIVGAGIGALFKGDRWARMPAEHLRVSVVPTRIPALAVSLNW